MDDPSRTAGMCASLGQLAVLGAFTTMLHSAAQAKVELKQTGPLAERMERAIDVANISVTASFSTTLHGAEFLA